MENTNGYSNIATIFGIDESKVILSRPQLIREGSDKDLNHPTKRIRDIFFEDIKTGDKRKITQYVIPKIIKTPFIKPPLKIETNFHEIGIDPFPKGRKKLVFVFSDDTKKEFLESTRDDRSIIINFPYEP